MAEGDETSKFRLTKDGKVYSKGKRTYPNGDVYEGEFVESLRHGKGIVRCFNGDRYDGEFERNLFHGHGVYVWITKVDERDQVIPGRRYDGGWKDGKFHGKGIYLIGEGDVYTGHFAKGMYEGKGTLKLENGDLYQGKWCRGLPSGHMTIKYASGDTYVGELSVGKYNGKGKYTYSRELGWYDGEWSLGKFNGKGVRLYSNGSKYVGDFVDGEIEGEGMMFFAHGDQYLGYWKRGKMEGKGVYRYKHGDSYEGSFLQSAPYGEGKYIYADGGFYQGEFKNLIHLNKHKGVEGLHRLPKCDGWRHGFGVRVWNSGTRYEGQWVEDKMHGNGMLQNREGAKYEGAFYNGLRSGRGTEQFGNLIGIPSCCPLGYKHHGNGYCTYTGGYRSGFFYGEGEFKCLSGPWYKGEWKMGKRQGQGEMYYFKEGEMGDSARLYIGGTGSLYRTLRYKGGWVDNVRAGFGVLTYTNGDTIEGHFEHGLPHGVFLCVFHSKAKKNNRGITVTRKRGARYEHGQRVEWIDVNSNVMKMFGAFEY